MMGKLGFNPYVCSHSISENNAHTSLFSSHTVRISSCSAGELYLVFLVASHKSWTEFLHRVLVGFERADHSDKPLQLSGIVQQFPHRRDTYVVQHTILFLSHHHLPERANEPLTAKKKPFISCWMDVSPICGDELVIEGFLDLYYASSLQKNSHCFPQRIIPFLLLCLFCWCFVEFFPRYLSYYNACSKQSYYSFHRAIDKTGAKL